MKDLALLTAGVEVVEVVEVDYQFLHLQLHPVWSKLGFRII